MVNEEFCARLVALRKSHHMTQKQVADRLGLNRVSYTCYEISTSSPGLDKLCQLADIFGVSIDYLLGRSNHKKLIDMEEGYLSTDEIELLENYRRLNDRQRRSLRELVKTI